MKKGIVSVLAATACMSLIACGGGKPKNMDDDTYNIGKQALAIEERYQSGGLDEQEALDQLHDLQDDLNSSWYKLDDNTQRVSNNGLSIAINSFCIDINALRDPSDDYSALKEQLGE